MMSCIALPKEAVKQVWTQQLNRLSCLVAYVKFQIVYIAKRKIASQHLLASTSSNILL